MHHEPINDADFLHNAHLTGIDHGKSLLVFSVDNNKHRLHVADTSLWNVGDVGRLRLPTENCSFAFHAYEDPALRRASDLDDPGRDLWGWRLGSRQILIATGVLPGAGGAFVTSDTEPLNIQIPREFRTLCKKCDLRPDTVLRGFIADLCGLVDFAIYPREDRYSSNSSDERMLAQEYFHRSYLWTVNGEEPHVRTVSLQTGKTVSELLCLRTVLTGATRLTVFNKEERTAAMELIPDIDRAIAADRHPQLTHEKPNDTNSADAKNALKIVLHLDKTTAAAVKRFAEKCSRQHAQEVLYPHVHENLRDQQASTILAGMEVVNRALADAGVRSWPWIDCGYPD